MIGIKYMDLHHYQILTNKQWHHISANFHMLLKFISLTHFEYHQINNDEDFREIGYIRSSPCTSDSKQAALVQVSLWWCSYFDNLLTQSVIIYTYLLWKNNEIPPKMFTSSITSSFSNLHIDYDVINVGLFTTNLTDQIDPFLEQNNIITPLLNIQYYNGTVVLQSLLNNSIEDKLETLRRAIDIKAGINYYFPNGSEFGNCDKTLVFVKCDIKYLSENQSCASDDIINAFFRQANNFLIITINQIILDQMNEPTLNAQTYYLTMEETMTNNLNIDLKTHVYSINQNLISSDPIKQEYISGAVPYCQTNTIGYNYKTHGVIAYAIIYIGVQPIQTQITLQYPEIGEILASLGSILQVLFLIKYFVLYLNGILLKKQILHQIIEFYYPQFNNMKIEYNIFQKIRSVKYKGQLINLEKFERIYNKLIQIAEQKITFNNIIYEQSRLYMILRNMKSQSELRQVHEMGIQLKSQDLMSPVESERYSQNNLDMSSQVLDDYDFDLVSLQQRNRSIDIITDEPPVQQTMRFKTMLTSNLKT